MNNLRDGVGFADPCDNNAGTAHLWVCNRWNFPPCSISFKPNKIYHPVRHKWKQDRMVWQAYSNLISSMDVIRMCIDHELYNKISLRRKLPRCIDMGHFSNYYKIDFIGKSNQAENCTGTFKIMQHMAMLSSIRCFFVKLRVLLNYSTLSCQVITALLLYCKTRHMG